MRFSLFLTALFTVFSAMGNNGDTVKVRTHDKVLIQTDPSAGHTEYPAWGVFPKPGKSYHKMYAEVTFQCPPGMTCGEWDYTNSISIVRRRGTHNDTLNWEIIRLITPYGLQFSPTWKHTWRFDITDFATLFADSIEIEYHHSGYEARNGRGWLVTLDFTMIEGPQVRPVQSVTMLYHKNVGYGNDSLFDANIPEVKYTTDNATQQVRYKVLQTGHGSDATGCGEFCAKMRYMVQDGKVIDSALVWRDDCGSNPVYPQGGTWVYDRANWCPGADVREYNLDVNVEEGSTHTIDLDMESYKGGGNYDITLYKIEYGRVTNDLDAAIDDIIAPSDEPRYNRLNPVCSNPTIVIKNNGTETLTEMRIDYGWQGAKLQSYTWHGSLNAFQSSQIELPAFKTFDSTGGIFIAKIIWVNGRRDGYELNNTIRSKPLSRVIQVPDKIIVYFKSNNAPTENYYNLRKADGTVVLDRKGFTQKNTIFKDTIYLEQGCYVLKFMDDGPPPASDPLNRDGLYWWANTNDGTGIFMIRNGYTNGVIKNFQPDFGTGIWFQIVSGNMPLPDRTQPIAGKMSVYPNPAQYDLMLDLGANRTGTLNIYLYDVVGKKILEQKRSGNLDAIQFLDVSVFPPGAYELVLKFGNENLTQKILIK